MDPDADSGGPKTYRGSYGSGSATLVENIIKFPFLLQAPASSQGGGGGGAGGGFGGGHNWGQGHRLQ
jgi:hypothetical protein